MWFVGLILFLAGFYVRDRHDQGWGTALVVLGAVLIAVDVLPELFGEGESLDDEVDALAA